MAEYRLCEYNDSLRQGRWLKPAPTEEEARARAAARTLGKVPALVVSIYGPGKRHPAETLVAHYRVGKEG